MAKKDPYEIKNDLSEFNERILKVYQPRKKSGKLKKQKIQISDAKDVYIPQQAFKYQTLKPTKQAKEAYLSQNEGLKRIRGRFKGKAVRNRIKKATKMPEFNLERVELIKPQFGLSQLPKKFFKE